MATQAVERRTGAAPRSRAMRFLGALAAIAPSIAVTTREGRILSLEEGLGQALEAIRGCAATGQTLMFIGNGGSAAIASHQAVDYWKNGGVRAVAFNDASLLTCIGNDYGYDRVFAEPIRRFADPGDLVVAISSSGASPNILRGIEAARERGCRLVTLSGFDGTNPLRGRGDLNFYVPSHSYGIVEVTHLGLLHALLDELMGHRPLHRAP